MKLEKLKTKPAVHASKRKGVACFLLRRMRLFLSVKEVALGQTYSIDRYGAHGRHFLVGGGGQAANGKNHFDMFLGRFLL